VRQSDIDTKLIKYILINDIYINFYDSFETFVAFEEKSMP